MFKGLTLAMLIVTVLLIGPAFVLAFTSPGYPNYCGLNIFVPCIGVE